MPATPSVSGIAVRGFRELSATFAKSDRDTRLRFKKIVRDVAEPVRYQAEVLTHQNIRNIGPRWSQWRIGATQKLVYVAPKQRGRQSAKNPALKRPNLAMVLSERVSGPVIEGTQPHLEQQAARMLDRIASEFNH